MALYPLQLKRSSHRCVSPRNCGRLLRIDSLESCTQLEDLAESWKKYILFGLNGKILTMVTTITITIVRITMIIVITTIIIGVQKTHLVDAPAVARDLLDKPLGGPGTHSLLKNCTYRAWIRTL